MVGGSLWRLPRGRASPGWPGASGRGRVGGRSVWASRPRATGRVRVSVPDSGRYAHACYVESVGSGNANDADGPGPPGFSAPETRGACRPRDGV